ncbi:Fic family protein [Actinacidiphila soli]|uniref:Fic family protein n=1 Tax=Actinacidiphila soli TaxID=2487275 RepID=UPI001F0C115A|nr:Fic family protein [Actinacidiphila soli]
MARWRPNYRPLTWHDVDPKRHPFVWDEAEEAYVTARIKEFVPPVLSRMEGWWQGERWCEGHVQDRHRAGARCRSGDAYAKGGRERYRLTSHTAKDFTRCLRGSDEQSVALAARAARAYLDVAFFHPFTDGNGRAALLTLTFVLAREGVVLGEVGPLQTIRYVDDPAGAADLAVLVGILIRTARRRAPVQLRPYLTL